MLDKHRMIIDIETFNDFMDERRNLIQALKTCRDALDNSYNLCGCGECGTCNAYIISEQLIKKSEETYDQPTKTKTTQTIIHLCEVKPITKHQRKQPHQVDN